MAKTPNERQEDRRARVRAMTSLERLRDDAAGAAIYTTEETAVIASIQTHLYLAANISAGLNAQLIADRVRFVSDAQEGDARDKALAQIEALRLTHRVTFPNF